jgi:hypothetical protein
MPGRSVAIFYSLAFSLCIWLAWYCYLRLSGLPDRRSDFAADLVAARALVVVDRST